MWQILFRTIALCVFITLGFGPTQNSFATANSVDDEYEQRQFELRRVHGMHHVVFLQGLVDDFKGGLISEDDLLEVALNEYQEVTVYLFEYWGDVNDCFLRELVFAQTNGVVGKDKQGKAIHFKYPKRSLLEFSQDSKVKIHQSKDLIATKQANAILQKLTVGWSDDPVCNVVRPTNNRCCKTSSGLVSCPPKTGFTCHLDAGENYCLQGSTQCP